MYLQESSDCERERGVMTDYDDALDVIDFSETVSLHARRKRRWRQRNPDRNRERDRIDQNNRRARLLGARGRITVAEWLMLVGKFGGRCLCCGEIRDLQIDHIRPLEHGGANSICNIQPLCEQCNKRKGRREIDYRGGVSDERATQAETPRGAQAQAQTGS